MQFRAKILFDLLISLICEFPDFTIFDFWVIKMLAVANRNVDPGIFILSASFQQQYRMASVRCQTVSQHTASATGTNNDKIENEVIGHT